MDNLTVGRIVHYIEKEPLDVDCRAALMTHVRKDGTVDLAVFVIG